MGEDRIAHAGQNGPSSAEPIRRALHTLDRLPQGALDQHPRTCKARYGAASFHVDPTGRSSASLLTR
jgi:hypothetical protein